VRKAQFFMALFLVGVAALPLAARGQTAAGETPIAVRVVVVANFENGADAGDAPGEYQDWVEREHLDEQVPVRGAGNVLRRNKDGLYGFLTRQGVADFCAFLLDPHFDLRKTYWLFTGISGVDPRVASVGSAAWARWVVNGDELREIDDRTVPAGWPYGLWAIGATKPNQLPYDPNHFGSVTDVAQLSMAYELNQGLARWAYEMTKDTPIPDSSKVIAAQRAQWKGFPQAQRPPFVLMGETLGARRYWHGDPRTRWAEDWVKLWTGGKGVFVMTNMESQTWEKLMRVFAAKGLVDHNRVMVLRSASNFSMPPPGGDAYISIEDESDGQTMGFDANQRVGSPVLHELLAHWDRYENTIPAK
jgi:purine nucleoside permease